jgi:hypothetical protein
MKLSLHPNKIKNKRIKSKESLYVKSLTNLVSIIAVLYPFTSIPQIYKIWVFKTAQGVSLLTWSLFLTFTIPLLLYSILKKEKRLMVMWSIWLLIYVAVISGIIVYS